MKMLNMILSLDQWGIGGDNKSHKTGISFEECYNSMNVTLIRISGKQLTPKEMVFVLASYSPTRQMIKSYVEKGIKEKRIIFEHDKDFYTIYELNIIIQKSEFVVPIRQAKIKINNYNSGGLIEPSDNYYVNNMYIGDLVELLIKADPECGELLSNINTNMLNDIDDWNRCTAYNLESIFNHNTDEVYKILNYFKSHRYESVSIQMPFTYDESELVTPLKFNNSQNTTGRVPIVSIGVFKKFLETNIDNPNINFGPLEYSIKQGLEPYGDHNLFSAIYHLRDFKRYCKCTFRNSFLYDILEYLLNDDIHNTEVPDALLIDIFSVCEIREDEILDRDAALITKLNLWDTVIENNKGKFSNEYLDLVKSKSEPDFDF